MSRFCSLVVFLIVCFLASPSAAQSTYTVTTPGLTAGQCVQSSGTASIVDSPCSGRTKTISTGASYTLSNTDCGAVIQNNGTAQTNITLPSSPPANCEFTFDTGLDGFYVNFNGQSALLPGYQGSVTQWTIPDVSAFRTNNESVSIQFNGTQWEQSAVSSSIYATTLQHNNAAQLAHGQVYFRWDSSASRFELCLQNGPGGIVVDGAMRQVPSDCLTLAQSATASSATNFFYAVHGAGDDLAVSNAVVDPSGKILLSFTTTVPGNVNDQVEIDCHSIGGAIQANISDTGKIQSATQIELVNTPSTGMGVYTSGGSCYLVRLSSLSTGHVTGDNGVEVNSSDPHYTLVGIAYIGASNAVNDSPTQRDVASWFNRHPKKMVVSCDSTMTTASSTLRTPSGSTCEGEFVVFSEPQGSPIPAVHWSINTGISNTISTAAVGNVTACFGTGSLAVATVCSNTPEPETGTSSLFSLSKVMPIGVSGMTTTLTEGRNFMDLIGDTSTGQMSYLTTGTNNDTTIGTALMQ